MRHCRPAVLLVATCLWSLVGCTAAQVPPSVVLESTSTLPEEVSPTISPTASPTPTATVTPTTVPTTLPTVTPTSTPETDPQALTMIRVRTDKPYVAIVVDDFFTDSNYRDQEGVRLLEAANKAQAALTLCPTGYALEAYKIVAPTQLEQIRELINRGSYEICNHTLSHPFLTTLGPEDLQNELSAGANLVSQHLGHPVGPFLRPPFGDWNDETLAAAAEAGFPYIVSWSVDSADWIDPAPSVDAVVTRVSCADAGDIVLMHANRAISAEALPRIVEQLRARGLELVTLSKLLDNGEPVIMEHDEDFAQMRYCS